MPLSEARPVRSLSWVPLCSLFWPVPQTDPALQSPSRVVVDVLRRLPCRVVAAAGGHHFC